jgi:hypothetical protein
VAVPGPLPTPTRAPWPAPDPRTLNQYPRPKHQRTINLMLVSAAIVGAGAVLAGALFFTGRDDGTIDAPDEWDPRVAGVIDEIEEIRQLEFEHPIAVTFLAEDDFVERVTSDNDDATDEELEQLERAEQLLRALGLVEGDVDLADEQDQLAAEGVMGFYDPGTEELVVRGSGDELDPMVMSTVVHELTHALQDQHFDLAAPLQAPSAGASTGGRALIEADASYVEQTWIERLSRRDAAEYDRLLREFIAAGDADGPPAVLEEALSFPYVFGPVLHAALLAEGGLDDVDEAYTDYPSSEEQVLFPTAYLDDDDPLPVEIPGEAAGDVRQEGEYGAFGLFQVLSGRLDYEQAFTAVEGWGGDAFRLVEREGITCVDLAVTADTDDDLDELAAAFADWVDGLDSASTEVSGDVVVLSSCDPGDALPPSRHRTETGSAFDALAFRATIQNEVMNGMGADLATATCAGDRFVDEIGVDRLSEINDTMNDDPEAQLPAEALDAFAAAVGEC